MGRKKSCLPLKSQGFCFKNMVFFVTKLCRYKKKHIDPDFYSHCSICKNEHMKREIFSVVCEQLKVLVKLSIFYRFFLFIVNTKFGPQAQLFPLPQKI